MLGRWLTCKRWRCVALQLARLSGGIEHVVIPDITWASSRDRGESTDKPPDLGERLSRLLNDARSFPAYDGLEKAWRRLLQRLGSRHGRWSRADPLDSWAMNTAQPHRGSAWQRFLDGKTRVQRLLLQVGAIAAALTAIAGVVAGVVAFVGDRLGDRADVDGATVVRSAEESADRFVKQLVEGDGDALQLDHKIIGRRGRADVTLEYNCQRSGRCNTTRVQAPATQPSDLPDGVWYQGCWTVAKVGNGYGAQPLDLQLTYQSATCPR
jgi:hypothetical protein